MNAELVQSEQEWYALRDQWDPLLKESVYPSIFLSFDYLTKAYALFHSDSSEPFILTVRDVDGLLIGIAPFRRTMHRRRGINQAVLEYLVTWEIDKPYIIAKNGWEEKVWAAIFTYLNQNPANWNLLQLAEIPDHLAGAKIVMQLFDTPAYRCQTEAGPDGPYIDLTGTWARFLEKHKKYRRALKQLEQLDANYEVVTYNDAATISEGLAHYTALERLSWKKGKTGLQRNPQHFEFYRQIVFAQAKKNRTSIHVLMNNEGRPLAAILSWLFADTLFVHHTTYDPELSKYSPGKVLMGLVLKSYMGDPALRKADLMCGFAHYYKPWADRLVTTTNVNIYRMSPGMVLLRAGRWIKGLFERAMTS
jgi:CelD/BcsL family acetyltransferase involved in cellulose biosynthesis